VHYQSHTAVKSDSAYKALKTKFQGQSGIRILVNKKQFIDTSAIRKAREAYVKKIQAEFKKPDFKFNGTATLSYNFTPQNSVDKQYPKHFITADMAPKIQFYGIPFTGHFFFTYDDIHLKPFFNQFNVSFDQRQFQNGLRNRLFSFLNTGTPGLPGSAYGTGDMNAGILNKLNPDNKYISAFQNSSLDYSSFNNIDKTIIQKYRYDQESLLRYKDSLEWTDPTKAKQITRITDQIQYQNTLRLLEQRDASSRQAYEDSLKKNNPGDFAKFKDMEAVNLLDKIEKDQWPAQKDLNKVIPISKAEALFYNVHTLNIGKSYLNYSQLSIQGVAVTGADIAYAPGRFFVEASYGELDLAQSLWYQNNYHQKYAVKGAKLGIGAPEKIHFHFIYLDFSAVGVIMADTGFNQRLPQKNTLFGFDMLINPVRNLLFKIECLRSFNTFNDSLNSPSHYLYAPGAKDLLSNQAIQFYSEYVLKPTATHLSTEINRIGTEYQTVGNPFLRNDIFNYGLHLGQAFLKNKINIRIGFKQEQDNLIKVKPLSSINTFFDGNLIISVPKYPLFTISYAPVYFYEHLQESTYFSKYSMASNLSASAGYQHVMSGFNLNSSVVFSHITNSNNITAYRFNLYSVMVNENLVIDRNSSCNGFFSYSIPKEGNDSLRVLTIDFSYRTLIRKKLSQTFGLKLNRFANQDLMYLYTKSTITIKGRFGVNAYIYQNINPFIDKKLQNNMVQVSGSVLW
jgi:hypothetical protein